MPEWLTKFLEQWAVVMAVPIPFIICLIAAAAVIWLALDWRYGSIVSHQAAEIKMLERAKGEATARPATTQLAASAELRLHTYGDSRTPSMISESNTWRWYFLRVIMTATEQPSGKKTEFVVPTLFVTFDTPVRVGTLEVSADFPLPKHEVKEFNNRFAIIVFDSDLPSGTLTISVH